MRAPEVRRAHRTLAVYARPAVAVGLVILTLLGGALNVLLVCRGEPRSRGS